MNLPAKCQQMSPGVPEFRAKKGSRGHSTRRPSALRWANYELQSGRTCKERKMDSGKLSGAILTDWDRFYRIEFPSIEIILFFRVKIF